MLEADDIWVAWVYFAPIVFLSRLLSAAAHAGFLQTSSTNAPTKTASVISWSPVRGMRSTTRRCRAVSPPKAAEIDFALAVQVGGHDNLAECARFLVQIGIRPEDVDRYEWVPGVAAPCPSCSVALRPRHIMF